ncbi:hypothetical protein B4U84_14575 [Westiellopsis prolifica IICB1]|nr:hypothetical protein B4U84_14575 [Westiellopsis prolifica IICB1]
MQTFTVSFPQLYLQFSRLLVKQFWILDFGFWIDLTVPPPNRQFGKWGLGVRMRRFWIAD